MIFLEATLQDVLDYISTTKDYTLGKYHGKASALSDPQLAVGVIRYLLANNLQVPAEYEFALFKMRTLDYAKRYIELLSQYHREAGPAFLSRISKTYLKDYYSEKNTSKPANQEEELSQFRIVLVPVIDSDLKSLISEAFIISKKLNTDLDFDFHNIKVHVTPVTNPDQLYNLISQKLSKT